MRNDHPLPTTVPIDPDDWARTPPSVQSAFLAMEERVKQLEARVAEILDRLNSNFLKFVKAPLIGSTRSRATQAEQVWTQTRWSAGSFRIAP